MPDEQVIAVEVPMAPLVQVYVRWSPSAVPLPATEVVGHDGALLQLPQGAHVGQEPTHKPDKHVLFVEGPTNPVLHLYVR